MHGMGCQVQVGSDKPPVLVRPSGQHHYKPSIEGCQETILRAGGGLYSVKRKRWVVRCRIIPAPRLKDEEMTYRTTNFLGFKDRTGSRAKQMTKQAMAARLQTAKIINRSQRLTIEITLSQPHAPYRK